MGCVYVVLMGCVFGAHRVCLACFQGKPGPIGPIGLAGRRGANGQKVRDITSCATLRSGLK